MNILPQTAISKHFSRLFTEKIKSAFAFIMLFTMCTTFPAYGVFLITPEEALFDEALGESLQSNMEFPSVSGEKRFLIIPKTAPSGPDIKVLSPEPEKATSSPIKLMALFIPREGTEVDISSLKVEYLKLITINITDRLKEYVTNNGIKVENAELPAGTHKIRITLSDTKGGTTSRVFTLKIQ